jgi:proline iminopeptidase
VKFRVRTLIVLVVVSTFAYWGIKLMIMRHNIAIGTGVATAELEDILFSSHSPYSIWFAQYGNPNGLPVFISHGGPGFRTKTTQVRFFDPSVYRIIVVDQRGTGKSKPFGNLKNNTTQDLVEDLDKLREHLKIDKWVLFGSSWGSLLSLAYGEAHADHVIGFIVHALFLGHELKSVLFAQNYYEKLFDPDPRINLAAAKSLIIITADKFRGEGVEDLIYDDKAALTAARIMAHYAKHNFFLKKDQIIDNIDRISTLPLFIVHGKADIVSTEMDVQNLHIKCAHSKLVMIEDAGHSSFNRHIVIALMAAAKEMSTSYYIQQEE